MPNLPAVQVSQELDPRGCKQSRTFRCFEISCNYGGFPFTSDFSKFYFGESSRSKTFVRPISLRRPIHARVKTTSKPPGTCHAGEGHLSSTLSIFRHPDPVWERLAFISLGCTGAPAQMLVGVAI